MEILLFHSFLNRYESIQTCITKSYTNVSSLSNKTLFYCHLSLFEVN